jgi:hypothetical protein
LRDPFPEFLELLGSLARRLPEFFRILARRGHNS